MEKKYQNHKNANILRFYLGDIRDRERLKKAFSDVNIIVHAAALKQVPTAEYNPMEYIKTNIIGAQNIIEEAMDANVDKIVALSKIKHLHP